jgi:hypothetical protein
MKKLVAALLIALVCAVVARADVQSTGGVTWRGKSISHTVTGKSSVHTGSSSNDSGCTVKISVDGSTYEVTVTNAGVEYKGTKETAKKAAKIPLKDFTKVEVTASGGELKIVVDGKQVLPKAEK